MSRPLLIDADPGCDDAVAILLAVAHPELELTGITTTHGNSSIENTTTNSQAILELFDATAVPVARGASSPLLVEPNTAEHIHGPNGIYGDLPDPPFDATVVESHAASFIVEQARAHDGDLALAAVGPLTNVALALALEPDLPALLDELIVMGGTVAAHGNVTPLAEANFHSDPEAAHKVVAEASPTVVGLNATLDATLSAEWIDGLGEETTRERSVTAWVSYYDDESLARYDLQTTPIHDALPVVSLLDDGVLETTRCHMTVGTQSAVDRGALAADLHGVTEAPSNGAVALGADRARFRDIVTETIEHAL